MIERGKVEIKITMEVNFKRYYIQCFNAIKPQELRLKLKLNNYFYCFLVHFHSIEFYLFLALFQMLRSGINDTIFFLFPCN